MINFATDTLGPFLGKYLSIFPCLIAISATSTARPAQVALGPAATEYSGATPPDCYSDWVESAPETPETQRHQKHRDPETRRLGDWETGRLGDWERDEGLTGTLTPLFVPLVLDHTTGFVRTLLSRERAAERFAERRFVDYFALDPRLH